VKALHAKIGELAAVPRHATELKFLTGPKIALQAPGPRSIGTPLGVRVRPIETLRHVAAGAVEHEWARRDAKPRSTDITSV